MNVFYADDDEEDREIFCSAVEEINPTIHVILSKDGQEALNILKTQTESPDFIFLDINMPRMNGIECLIKLKADNRLKSVPVIMYSTTADSREINKMKMLGAAGFIQKSSSFEELKRTIHKVLKREYFYNSSEHLKLYSPQE